MNEMVAAMDKVGVDGAIVISAFSMYRYDASYAVEVQRAHPARFAIVQAPSTAAAGLSIAVTGRGNRAMVGSLHRSGHR